MMAAHFEAFLTVDQNLEFQQNLRASNIGVILVVAKTNRVKELRLSVPQILGALNSVRPGELVRRLTGRCSRRTGTLIPSPFS